MKQFLYLPSVGFSVDINRMDLPADKLETQAASFSEAISEMKALEAGERVNKDEDRMVGHYWLRAPELSPNDDIKKQIVSQIEACKKLQADSKFKNLVVIGIGGSALGPQLLEDALSSVNDPVKLFFCDNTDPDGAKRLASKIDFAETLFAVVSKSGGTVETRNGMLEFKHMCEQAGEKFEDHAVAITTPGSKLDKLAANWFRTLYLYDWVGGRTSLWSPVGLVPLALMGQNIDKLLTGARKMDELTREDNLHKNPAALIATCWQLSSKDTMVVLPYCDRLMLFSKYLQQLIMESVGKQFDRSGKEVFEGINVFGNKGSTDQHAYVQQLREGPNNFYTCFIQCLNTPGSDGELIEVEPGVTSADYLQGFMLGTRRALYENGRKSFTITIDKLSLESLGALIALFERAVSFYATFNNINAYHQPGVEAGKKAAQAAIELQRSLIESLGSEGKTVSELVTNQDDFESAFYTLRYLAVSGAHGVKAQGSYENPEKVKFRV